MTARTSTALAARTARSRSGPINRWSGTYGDAATSTDVRDDAYGSRQVLWCYARRVMAGSREERLDRLTRAIRVARDAFSEHTASCGACTPSQASSDCSVGSRLQASASELEVQKKALESSTG